MCVLHHHGTTPPSISGETQHQLALVDQDYQAKNRMNDGKCDARGRLWCGIMGYEKSPGEPVSSQRNSVLLPWRYTFSHLDGVCLSHRQGVRYNLIAVMPICTNKPTHSLPPPPTPTHTHSEFPAPHMTSCCSGGGWGCLSPTQH